jgi:hypothetical protein
VVVFGKLPTDEQQVPREDKFHLKFGVLLCPDEAFPT